jgi:LysM repeat protein
LPAETAGALKGTTGDRGAGGGVQIYITSVVPLGLVSARSGVVPSQVEWADLKARLAAEGAESGGSAERIVGWFYADPGIGIFPRRIDLAAAHAALAPDAELFLLVNPASDRGALYTWRDGDFVRIDGFYEALDEIGAEAAIPWDGEVPGAAEWMRGPDADVGMNASIGGYVPASEYQGAVTNTGDRSRARLIAGVILGLTVTAALVGSLFLFGRLGQGSPVPAETQLTPVASATIVPTMAIAGKTTATFVPTSIPTSSATAVGPTATVEAPATSTPTVVVEPTPTVLTYVVKRGDTLTAIAAQFGATPQAIMAANGLKDTIIAVGQVLTIPSPVSPQTATRVATPSRVDTQLRSPTPAGTEPLPHPVPSAVSTLVSR